MTVALGASAYSAAIFHLMTHAFFKALLFLAAGSVIIGMHHDQDIRNMGGLRKYMPVTWLTSLIGSLALIGTPFFAGFYSKDSVITSYSIHYTKLYDISAITRSCLSRQTAACAWSRSKRPPSLSPHAQRLSQMG